MEILVFSFIFVAVVPLLGKIIVSCFFFFKQKTAYEMRISDWSSDVCSSDLTHEGWDERLGSEMPFELRVGEDMLFAGAGRIRRIEPHGNRMTVAVEFTTGFLDIPALVTDHDNLLLTRALAAPAFGTSEGILPEFVQLCTERSDEHTSELKSLMRISYAVSCLK